MTACAFVVCRWLLLRWLFMELIDCLVYLLSLHTAVSSVHFYTFDNIICPNTNTLFGPLFGPNRIQTEYSVNQYHLLEIF